VPVPDTAAGNFPLLFALCRYGQILCALHGVSAMFTPTLETAAVFPRGFGLPEMRA